MQKALCFQCGAPCDWEALKYPTPLCPPCAKVKIAARTAQRAAGNANRAAERQREKELAAISHRRIAYERKEKAKAERRAERIRRKAEKKAAEYEKARIQKSAQKAAALAALDDTERERRKAQSERDRMEFRRAKWAARYGRGICQKRRNPTKAIPGIIASPENKPAEIIP